MASGQPERVRDLQRGRRRQPDVEQALLDPQRQVRPQRALRRAVEGRRRDRDHEHRDRARERVEAGERPTAAGAPTGGGRASAAARSRRTCGTGPRSRRRCASTGRRRRGSSRRAARRRRPARRSRCRSGPRTRRRPARRPRTRSGRRRRASGRGARGRAAPRGARRRRVRRAIQPTARPTARHGLNAANTSPRNRLSTGTPVQNTTHTSVGARFAAVDCVPDSPAHTTIANSATPIVPARSSSTSGTRSSVRSLRSGSSSRGVCHRAASAMKEMTRTAVAAHAKTTRGIGRSSRPTKPWADAASGTSAATSAAAASATAAPVSRLTTGGPRARRAARRSGGPRPRRSPRGSP